jgi:hypothetical protein
MACDDAWPQAAEAPPSWVLMNDWSTRFGLIQFVQGDSQTYGRIYVATNGRGILVGDLAAL